MGEKKGYSMLLKGHGIAVRTFVLIGGILLMTVAVGGCNSSEEKPEWVRIKGKVTTSDGAPINGVRLVLTPEGGDPLTATADFQLDQTGSFEGAAVPGMYGYYFVPVAIETDDGGKPVNTTEAKKLRDSYQLLKKLVPPAYQSPNTAATVNVTAEADIALTLSK